MRRCSALLLDAVASVALTLILTGTAVAKWWTGYGAHLSTSATVYYALMFAELASAVMLWTRWQRWTRWSVAAASVLAVIVSLAWPATRCGCMGAELDLEPAQRLALLAAIGCCALLPEIAGTAALKNRC